MTPKQQANLHRLLKPRHIAFIGGSDAETALRSCQRIGYQGDIWAVNHKRDKLADIECFASVEQLPQIPDAVFLAVPAKPALEIVKWLADHGAGGVVCYTAGFSDDGKEGGSSDQPLVDVAGDMAIVGPNCYGLINFVDQVALWPFAHGGFCPGYGAAIITQSGMLSSDITMNQRALPLAYMVSAGNQSVIQIEDYVDLLCELDTVKAIGLHVEGLKDVESFSRAARKALALNKPIVVLKTGTSKIGAQLTISHTGSLSGTHEVYQALFDRLGIISVSNPAQFLETLKLICVSGIPRGKRLMGFTCSGGGATMLADYAEKIGLEFPQPLADTEVDLVAKLPSIANVSNPLDYTTPIWGDAKKLPAVFESALGDHYDAAIIVQDYPLPHCDESKPYYLRDAQSFIQATSKFGLPSIVCATLAENIDQPTREYLIENGVTPSQGIHETLNAVAAAIGYGQQRSQILEQVSDQFLITQVGDKTQQIDEYSAKTALASANMKVPLGRLANTGNALQIAEQIAEQYGYPIVLKLNSNDVAHKTEIGAVAIGLNSADEVEAALETMQANIALARPDLDVSCFLIEQMQPKPIVELMVNIRRDAQFGLVMTLASGGVMIELLNDAVTLILPANESEILRAIDQLKLSTLMNGYRGGEAVNKAILVDTLTRLMDYVASDSDPIAEIEINPLFVYANDICAVDVLTQHYRANPTNHEQD